MVTFAAKLVVTVIWLAWGTGAVLSAVESELRPAELPVALPTLRSMPQMQSSNGLGNNLTFEIVIWKVTHKACTPC